MPESIPVYAHHRCWCSKLSPTIHLMAALGSLWAAAEKLGSSWSLLLASQVQKTSNRICAVRQFLTEKKLKKWRQEEERGEDKQAETLLGVLPPAPAASLEGIDSGHHRNTVAWHWNFANYIETTEHFFCFHMLSDIVKNSKILIISCHCRRLDFCCCLFMNLWPLVT